MNPSKPATEICLCDSCRKVIALADAIGRPPLCPRCHRQEKDYPNQNARRVRPRIEKES